MATSTTDTSRRLAARFSRFGKENLEEILHALTEAVLGITRLSRCRIYLEDLTRGQLVCSAYSGRYPQDVSSTSFPLNSDDFLVSRSFLHQEEAQIEDIRKLEHDNARQLAEHLSVRASYLLPIMHHGHPLGVVCVDSSRAGKLPDARQRQELHAFLAEVVATVDQARKYHQQLLLARQIDEAKAKEAGLYMVKSAVRLIDKLELASVLVPGDSGSGERSGLQILASYSQNRESQRLYEQSRMISLDPGSSLLSRYINNAGVITDERMLSPFSVADLNAEPLQKQYLTEDLGLKSLYVVPFYDEHSRQVSCLVNYYTGETHHFSEFEKGLLEAHAEMAQRVIREIGAEHMEIQVLSEIGDLLHEKVEGLQPFLNRILSKATELIGADTGSIALLRESDGDRWLLVENDAGELIGAKSKEWLKKNIPPLKVGGEELPPEERSLSGYVAHMRHPATVTDTRTAVRDGGFYREMTDAIRSELAVPVIIEDEVIAVICLDSLKPNYFTEEHKRILLIIARLIARHLADLQQIEQLTTEVNLLRSDVGYRDPKISSYRLGNIIGNSQKALAVIDFIERTTPPVFNRIAAWSGRNLQEATLGLPSILMTGETGSGKEFVFNNIFSRLNEMYQGRFGADSQLPLQKTNIAAYSGELTYSELFGHKRGAFTGAHADRRGILEEAHGGVVFLDEIGDADPKTQVQLLRFLDNGGFVRLGENLTRYARVLLVAATNKNLPQLIREGRFREDLFHRLSELTLPVPSLNERREDIPDLATHFLGRLYSIYRSPDEPESAVPEIAPDARELLSRHLYTGNIRELRSILLRALFLRRGNTISAEEIRQALDQDPNGGTPGISDALASRSAEQLLTDIMEEREDFWSGIYRPYSENRLTRDTIQRVIDLARGRGGTNMPKIAAMLHACDPHSDDPEQRKTFYRFKNFLYKTVRIS